MSRFAGRWRRRGPTADERLGDSLERGTPYRFVLIVDPDEGDRAEVALDPTAGSLAGRSLDSVVRIDAAHTRLEVVSSLSSADLALRRSLHLLRAAGVQVVGYERFDLVRDVGDAWIEEVLTLWERFGNNGAGRRRLEALAGQAVLDRLLAWARESDRGRSPRWHLAFAAGQVITNEPFGNGPAQVLAAGIELAGRGRSDDASVAGRLLDMVRDVAQLRSFGLPIALDTELAVDLLDHPSWEVHGVATELLGVVPADADDASVDLLVALAHQLATSPGSQEVRAAQVAFAVGRCPDEPRVRAALHALLGHRGHEVRSEAAMALARLGGRDEALPIWETFAAARSSNDKLTAEALLTTYGDHRDVVAAADMLTARTARVGSTSYSPPVGSALIDFLGQFRDDPAAVAAFERLTARHERLAPELQEWLAEHHPELVPPSAAGPTSG